MPVPTLADGSELGEVIASDGVGATFRATGPDGAPLLAVVIDEALSADEALRTRVRRERPVLVGLVSRHLVGWSAVQVDDDGVVLVSPRPEVPDLGAQLAAGDAPGVAAALRICADVCFGLTAAHAAGLTHGDISVLAVFLDGPPARSSTTPTARLAGVGVLALARPTLQALGRRSEPIDAAPEVLAGGPLTPAADLWQVGLLLAGLLGAEAAEDGTLVEPAGLPEGVWAEVEVLTSTDLDARGNSARKAASRLSTLAVRLAAGAPAPARIAPRPAPVVEPVALPDAPVVVPAVELPVEVVPDQIPEPQSLVEPQALVEPEPDVVPEPEAIAEPALPENQAALEPEPFVEYHFGSPVEPEPVEPEPVEPEPVEPELAPEPDPEPDESEPEPELETAEPFEEPSVVAAPVQLTKPGTDDATAPALPTAAEVPLTTPATAPTPDLVDVTPAKPRRRRRPRLAIVLTLAVIAVVVGLWVVLTLVLKDSGSTPVAAPPLPSPTPTPLVVSSAPSPTTRASEVPVPGDQEIAKATVITSGDLGPHIPTLTSLPGGDFNSLLRALYAYCDYYTPMVDKRTGHVFAGYAEGTVAVWNDAAVYTGTGAADLVTGIRSSLSTCTAPITARDAQGGVLGVYTVSTASPPSTAPPNSVALTYRRTDAPAPITHAVFMSRGRVLSVVLTVTNTDTTTSTTDLKQAVKRAAVRLARVPAS